MFIWNQRVAILEAVIQAESQIVSWLQSEGEGFLREKKRNKLHEKKKKFLLGLTSWATLVYIWLVTDSIFK